MTMLWPAATPVNSTLAKEMMVSFFGQACSCPRISLFCWLAHVSLTKVDSLAGGPLQAILTALVAEPEITD